VGNAYALAQLVKIPLHQNQSRSSYSSPELKAGRKHSTLLSLPFWDDFSNANGMEPRLYPDTLRWEDGYRVWINNGMGINQPTVYVATFDGLDSVGIAYNRQVGGTGFNDHLVSQPINLNETAVTLAERNSVFISFFYQWQGNGEAPDNDDYLQLEFKTKRTAEDSSRWTPVLKISPKPSFDLTAFYDTIIQVSDTSFFHDEFQFRFRNFGRQSGPYDTWNIDYVYLNKNRTIDDLAFPDRALASGLTSLFGNYRSVPYRQFKHSKHIDSVDFEIQNLSERFSSVRYSVDGTFTNIINDSTSNVFSKNFVFQRAIRQNPQDTTLSGVMNPFERVTSSYNISLPDVNDPQQFDPEAKAVIIDFDFRLESGDTAVLKYAPIDFKTNDTTSARYYLDDYYAYDDGIAEFSAGLTQPGEMIAIQFDMLLSDSLKADTLAGIDYYFPPYAVSSNQTITFFVYHDAGGKPGDLWQTYSPRPIQQAGLNVFQQLPFNPALLINEQRFYIGWRQPIEGKALIGLDIDNDSGNRIFVNSNGVDWVQNENLKGSLMLRPYFGKGQLEGDYNTGIEDEFEMSLYPNPSTGNFYIEGAYDEMRVYNATGNEVFYDSNREDHRTHIHIQQPSGLYLLRITKEKRIITQKILIAR
jgi:hypothetical protein